MDYFAGLDISMNETHICVLDREGAVVFEAKSASIADELAKAPSCRRIVFETGRMAPILFHGLSQLGLPVVCVESRQAYQALKSLATHKTDCNDARGLAHLARTGFFKPVHVKSLSAHALRSLIIARKKLVGQRVTLENQIRGLAIVFGIRLPRALAAAFVDQALKASESAPAGPVGQLVGTLSVPEVPVCLRISALIPGSPVFVCNAMSSCCQAISIAPSHASADVTISAKWPLRCEMSIVRFSFAFSAVSVS
jgi:Transposase